MGLSFVVQDAPDLTIPEDVILRARLEKIDLREFEWNDKKTGERKQGSNLEWTFEITAEGEYKGRTVRGRTGTDMNNRDGNRLRSWAETLLGRELPVGVAVDADDLVGLSCDLNVRHEPDRKDPERKWERVDNIMPVSSDFALNDPPF